MSSNAMLSHSADTTRGHVLLVSAPLFSYHISISESLQSMGYIVTWWDDRASSSVLYKVLLRLFPILTVKYSESYYLKRLEHIDPKVVTHVLVIKGEGLSSKLVTKFREYFPAASMGLYLWDGVKNVKGALRIYSAFDSVATFDPVDAKRYNWTHRPLFVRNTSNKIDTAKPKDYDVCFIGTIHSDRHRVLHRLRNKYGPSLRMYIFAYFQSPIILFIRFFFDWTLFGAPKNTIKLTPLSPLEIMEIVGRSRAVLDIEHPGQRGLTMRTIETLLAQKKLITTNRHIVDSDLFHPSRVHLINRNHPEIPSEFFEQFFLPVPDKIRDYYSCDGWVKELISLQDGAKMSRLDTLKNF